MNLNSSQHKRSSGNKSGGGGSFSNLKCCGPQMKEITKLTKENYMLFQTCHKMNIFWRGNNSHAVKLYYS